MDISNPVLPPHQTGLMGAREWQTARRGKEQKLC